MKKHPFQITAVLASGLLCCTSLMACRSDSAGSAVSSKPERQILSAVSVDTSKAEPGSKKQETVQAKADANGVIRTVTDKVVLQNKGKQKWISDKTDLSQIKNTQGNELFQKESNGRLYWQNLGKSISYEGKSQQKPPVGVEIYYLLNGKEITPKKLVGQNGKVTIKIHYKNTGSVPFMAISTVLMSKEHFSNVKVKHGRVAEVDQNYLVLGTGFPGWESQLQLKNIDKKLELTDEVEITADVTDFRLDYTETIFTAQPITELKEKQLNNGEDLIKGIRTMASGSKKLVESSEQIYRGSMQYRGYLERYQKGVKTFAKGTKLVSEGLESGCQNAKKMERATLTFSKGIQSVYQSVSPYLSQDHQKRAVRALKQLQKDAYALSKEKKKVLQQLQEVQDYVKKAEMYRYTLNRQLSEASKYLEAVDWTAVSRSYEKKAKEQAKSAVSDALVGTTLTESQKSKILNSIDASIDLSSVDQSSKKSLEKAKKILKELPEAPKRPSGLQLSEIEQLLSDIKKQFIILKSLTGNKSGEQNLKQSLQKLEQTLGQLCSGGKKIAQGSADFSDGLHQLYRGSRTVDQGAWKLVSSGSVLINGYSKLLSGQSSFSGGLRTFDRKGMEKLRKKPLSEVESSIRSFKDMRRNAKNYNTFSGLEKGTDGSVTFLIETDSIK